LLTLAWFVGFSVIPEGLAVPLAHRVHGGPGAVGLLLAASPLGTVAGVFILGRRVAPSRRLRLVPPLAALSVVPLIALAARPPLAVTLALLSASGLGAAYNLPANTAFVTLIPDEVRGRAFGLVNSGMYLAQGGGIVAAGALAQRLDPYFVVAIFGGLGLLTWCVRAAVWSQMFSTIPALVDLEPKTDEPIPVPATA
jgi:predicted MFS family arabinose efflux permease